MLSFWNIIPKKVNIHINVDKIFEKDGPKKWEEYLYLKHQRLQENYQNAKSLLYQKANCTKLSLVFLILSVVILIVMQLFVIYD